MDTKLIREITYSHDEAPDENSWETRERVRGFSCPWVSCTPSKALAALHNGLEVRRKPTTITRTVTVPKPKSETTLTGGEPGRYCLNVMSGLFWYENEQDRDDAAETILSLLRGD